ncbi:MAG: Na+/H+ antiporter NhaC family protein, partial [Muribaculaceae bacterium]|nr:Na+/H+ antiporter NhaC family protein [Muribaculaceae bacterium]
MEKTDTHIKTAQGLFALSPIVVFLTLYLVVSLILEDFYKMPIAVALTISSVWAIITYRHKTLHERIEVFSREAGSGNILYMIWIFVLAGAFACLADKTGSIQTTVALTMNWLPPSLIIPGIFIAACFISTSIGTSVGTVVALTPLAVDFAQSVGGEVPFFVAVVLGGAFFGDNLSFISDTTIAATRTQKCKMNEKFKANFAIVFPAAVITLAIYMTGNFHVSASVPHQDVNLWLIIPYLMIIALAIAGVNVAVTLICGIISAITIAILSAGYDIISLLGFMGEGIDSMGNLI